VRAVIDRIAADADELARARESGTWTPPRCCPAGARSAAGGWPGRAWPGLWHPAAAARFPAPQRSGAGDAWQAERYQRGKTGQQPGYTGNPFRPR